MAVKRDLVFIHSAGPKPRYLARQGPIFRDLQHRRTVLGAGGLGSN